MQQGYEETEEVVMKVREDGYLCVKKFAIRAAKLNGGLWEYQLNDADDNEYDGGKWFPEKSLKRPREWQVN